MKLYQSPAFQALAGATWRPGGLKVTRRGLSVCAWSDGALVADVGCGPGGTARLLREAGLRVLPFDSEPQTPETLQADACALPVANASLDGVVCECVLSLLPEPERAVGEFFRVLRLGGRALISDVTVDVATPFAPDQRVGCRQQANSCVEGALHPAQMIAWFRTAGFRLLLEEDHRSAMREFAAQLLWHGVSLRECPGAGCAGTLGYHLWILEKDVPCLN